MHKSVEKNHSIPHLLQPQSRGINPPPTRAIVQGDQSPKNILEKMKSVEKFHSIPHLLGPQSRGINPPPTRTIVQGDQSPNTLLEKVRLVKKFIQSLTTQTSSLAGSIPHQLAPQSRGSNIEFRVHFLEINPPPTTALVQGDQSPTYYRHSPGGLIPQHPLVQSRGMATLTTLLEKLRYDKILFNPPPTGLLVQGDQSPNTLLLVHGGSGVQSPTYRGPSPGGSIPHLLGTLSRGINPPATRLLVQWDQSPTYQGPSPGGSIPQAKGLQSSGINPPQSSGIQRVHMRQSGRYLASLLLYTRQTGTNTGVWYIPPTRGRESLCLPSPRAVTRGP